MDRDTADRSVSVRITIGKKTRWRHFVTSLPLLIVFILSLLMNGKFKPLAQRGFFCDDNSIRYPIKSDTIGMKTLFLFALFIPGLLIKFCDRTITRLADSYNSRRRRKSSDAARLDFEQETLIPHSNGRRRKQVGESSSNSRDSDQEAVDSTECKPSTSESGSDFGEVELFNKASWDRNTEPLSGGQTWSKFDSNPFGFRMFFFGLTTTLFFAGLGKLACGRLRPHFMQACNPDIDCSAKENSLKYIESFVCKNIAMDSPSFSYITTSWPSGKFFCHRETSHLYKLTLIVLYQL